MYFYTAVKLFAHLIFIRALAYENFTNDGTCGHPYIFHEVHDYLKTDVAEDVYLQLSSLLDRYFVCVLFGTSIPTLFHNLFLY